MSPMRNTYRPRLPKQATSAKKLRSSAQMLRNKPPPLVRRRRHAEILDGPVPSMWEFASPSGPQPHARAGVRAQPPPRRTDTGACS